jgi:uncharacterized membrane protein YwaF
MMAEVLLAAVVGAILLAAIIDLVKANIQISKMVAALLLIVLGAIFLLMAVQMGLSVMLVTANVGGKEIIGIYMDDFLKLLSAVGIGTAGMAIITGGFSLIAGGKYEINLSSTEPIQGIEIKK